MGSFAQPATSSFEYHPSFSAIVVKNLDSSAKWYQSVFDLKLKGHMKDENAGYNIFILESPSLTIELLELKNSFNPKNLLKDKPEGTQLQGFFKIGFKVADIDACLKHFADLNISVPGIWSDSKTQKRNFIVSDPDGNLVQFFD